MTLKVYGVLQATFTQRVLVVLKEKNVSYEFITVDWAGKTHKAPSYLLNHPFGQFPYIDDDGFILYESIAIMKYIALKYRDQGAPLLPDPGDLKATALMEQACSVEASNFNPFTTPIVIEKYGKPIRGVEPDEEVVKECVLGLDSKLDGYELILAKQRYLAGDSITIADLAHLPTGTIISRVGVTLLEDFTKRPNVTRWWREIYTRPSWQEVVASADAKI
ncbi:glutathione transferase [Irpex rosettiformis]|uniref:Glutathione transferase n=1 Tax=Irpex rosettiformis TaxID=378272 RepID=A0ACB8UDA5_9APHY|nr:glutathione transferase [Irpex rosettiformis]